VGRVKSPQPSMTSPGARVAAAARRVLGSAVPLLGRTDEAPLRTAPESARRVWPAGQVLVAMLVCLLVWVFLDARSLQREAEASPIGARRSVALALLGPLASVGGFLQLDSIRGAIDAVTGRDTGTGISIAPVPQAPVVGSGGEKLPENLEGPLRPATQEDPLRVVVVGDSFASGVGAAMLRAMNPRTVDVESRGLISTGLTRPDYFNWQKAYEQIVHRFRPDLTVVMLGGNDTQTMTVPGSKDVPLTQRTTWEGLYLDRIDRFMESGTSESGRLVWVGLPPMRDDIRSRQGGRLDRLYEREADRHDGVSFVDTYDLFARPGGGYTAYLPDDRGRQELIREADGEHFTTAGYDRLAQAILDSVQHDWGFRGNVERS
jgi:lysophospholipase L1-like esterase